MSGCGEQLAIVVGEKRPARSVSFADPHAFFSGFVVFFSEFDPDDSDDATPTAAECLDCLVDEGDAQLARGLDLARVHGQVDYDVESGEWFEAAE